VKPIRIVLVEDHTLVRRGLRIILDPDPALRSVGRGCPAAEALRLVTEGRPDAVLPYGFRTAFCAYHKEINQDFYAEPKLGANLR
jgi:hypothetical protein